MFNLYDECKDAKKIAISAHIRPDGDAVGSCMAMALYLRKRIPGVEVDVYLDPIADYFLCIKDSEKIINVNPVVDGKVDIIYDIFICVDCGPMRMSFGQELFDSAKKRINIDHHVTNPDGYGEVNYMEPESGSAAELVYKTLDKEYLDADIALPIYIGIIHDTGVLQYSNVRPETLRTVSELIEYGFDFPNIILKTFYEKTYVQSQILAKAIMDSTLIMDGRIIASVTAKKTMDDMNADSRDLEGVVNQLRNIRGVDCAIYMYELDTNKYKVSLRTTEAVDAAKVTAVYDGGGHERAAGVTMTGTSQEITDKLVAEIAKQF